MEQHDPVLVPDPRIDAGRLFFGQTLLSQTDQRSCAQRTEKKWTDGTAPAATR